ncbi:MAG: diadenylate cyclase [Deltaproteobacteria bacterium]|nr:diadenylate cyclase [Deltaproteobacteria bacterium]
MIKNSESLAKSLKAQAYFVFADCLESKQISLDLPKTCQAILVTQKPKRYRQEFKKAFLHQINLPKIDLGRLGLVKASLALALSTGLISEKEKVIFLSGNANQNSLDTLIVLEIGSDKDFLSSTKLQGLSEVVEPQVFEACFNLCIELASLGREGKPIGTIFVLGDEEKVLQLSKQMIMNPFKGYEEEERNILNPKLKETIREFSALDGAFIIDKKGTVLTAGRFLGATAEATEVSRGLGSRHLAAAGITALSEALALVVSESTGSLRLFKGGKTILEIEKP